MKIEIKEGRELSKEELGIINTWRKKEFHHFSPITILPSNENWHKKFFLVKDDARILAFGRLHEVPVEYMNNTYSILGIATIVAIEKGKGFGSSLVKAMVSFIKKDGRTAIGFCNSAISEFYKKCACGIIKGTDRFLYKDSEGNMKKTDKPGDVLYIEGKDNLISKILANPNEPVYLLRPHW